jgi:hypothetical protein
VWQSSRGLAPATGSAASHGRSAAIRGRALGCQPRVRPPTGAHPVTDRLAISPALIKLRTYHALLASHFRNLSMVSLMPPLYPCWGYFNLPYYSEFRMYLPNRGPKKKLTGQPPKEIGKNIHGGVNSLDLSKSTNVTIWLCTSTSIFLF